MNQELRFWGYRHANGGLHLMRYFDYRDIEQADEFPFVNKVFGPFRSTSFEDASKELKRRSEGKETKL